MFQNIIILSAFVLSFTGCMTIQNHWEHVKFKLLAPARVDVRDSGEVVLVCSATGSPAPVVTWYKDGLFVYHEPDQSLVEEDGSASLGETVSRLRLPCIAAKDAGKYECRAVAGKQQVSAITEVNVVTWDTNLCNERGEPEISVWRPTVMVETGSSVTLPCRADNAGVTTWTDSKGASVDTDDRIHVLDTGDLRITRVTWSDMGQYTCTVTNTAGRDVIHTFLYPLAAPAG